MNRAADQFAILIRELTPADGVSLGQGRRGFGSGTLMVDGHIFAMVQGERIVLKLPAPRVAELIASGRGHPFGAGKSRPLREWVALDQANADWRRIADEALAFGRAGRPR